MIYSTGKMVRIVVVASFSGTQNRAHGPGHRVTRTDKWRARIAVLKGRGHIDCVAQACNAQARMRQPRRSPQAVRPIPRFPPDSRCAWLSFVRCAEVDAFSMNKSAPQLGVFTWSCAACCSAETCRMTLDDPDVTGALPATVGSLSCRSKVVELYAQDRPT